MITSQRPPEQDFDSTFEAFHAPRGHGERLIRPALDDAEGLVRHNRQLATAYPTDLASLRESARRQLLRDARRYTSAYRDVEFASPSVVSPETNIVMAGHQPTLFHPGVWFKNFALDRVGRQTNSIAVNLVVDSDVAGPSSIRVPHLHRATGTLGFDVVAYDRRGGGVPYEQALIEDRELFDAFDRNVAAAVAGVVNDPVIGSLWRYAREAITRCGYAGCALAQARHRLEADLGLQTLEIPQSVVCRSEAFAAFAMQILRDLPRFHHCYNGAAEFYRKAHRIRSSAHPVPNLGRDGDWFEAPFWVYGNQSPKRRSLWVRTSAAGSVIEISDRDGRHRRIDAASQSDAAEAFYALASPEMKIRSRALVTTMYARLVLSDLFLHGIGGGKYDQLGDLIARAFWGILTPKFMVMSATVLLPGHGRFPVEAIDDELHRLHRQRRDMEYQPERFASEADLPDDLIASKRSLLAAVPPRGQRRDWTEQVTQVNQKMSARLEPLRRQLDSQRHLLQEQRREAAIWNSREQSFCVYPLDYLTDAYDEMLGLD